MKISIDLSEDQLKLLQSCADFDIEKWITQKTIEKLNQIRAQNSGINIVIAAAGNNTRISQGEHEIPKAMLKIKGKSILERQINVLSSYNIKEISVIRGFKKEIFNIPNITYIDNDKYGQTGILYSFHLAQEKIVGKTILMYGDILFEKWIFDKLVNDNSDFSVVVDRDWKRHYRDRIHHTISEAELVEVKDGNVIHMGIDIPYNTAYGEFIGMVAVSENGAAKMVDFLKRLNYSQNGNQKNKSFYKASLTELFNGLIEKGEKIQSVDISGGWLEIDTFEDFRKSWSMVK